MNKRLQILILAGVTTALVAGVGPARKARGDRPAKGSIALFNGKDFTGWHGQKTMDPRSFEALGSDEKAKALAAATEDLAKHWRVENGEIINDGQGAYLTSDNNYGDIELSIDFKIGPKGDSGIYLRGTPQIQIWDFSEPSYTRMGANKGSGGLWNNSVGAPGKDPLTLADRPINEWNTFRIIQVGERTTVYLNDKLVVDCARLENYWDRKLPLPAKGPIQLQTHDHEIHWRNISVREIPADEANQVLAKHAAAGFRPIFNGQNLADWAGPVENYDVNDGILRCKPHRGGTIFFNTEFIDFMARVEFKLPPGGNNGLAIRYPGHGDTAYVGMCELQILDDGASQYSQLDPRQANGSAYGMVPAHRGYLRPVGQWNFEEVTIKDSKVKVELNGTVILDTDLGQVNEFMAHSPHPGKDRSSGYFGLAGHSDPVGFRNLAVKVFD
jgi:Domain of Unknown Function (DUF1080)